MIISQASLYSPWLTLYVCSCWNVLSTLCVCPLSINSCRTRKMLWSGPERGEINQIEQNCLNWLTTTEHLPPVWIFFLISFWLTALTHDFHPPEVKTFELKWFHYHKSTFQTNKQKKTKEKAFQSCWFRLWNTNILHVKEELQAGAPKVPPPGAVVLCGQWEMVEFSTTYSLLEPRFTSPVGHTTSVCPSNNQLFYFSPGLVHKDGNIREGFVMAKANSADFYSTGYTSGEGESMIEKACLNDFSGTWAGEGGVLKPYAIHFMSVIFLWSILKNCIWWCRRRSETVAERFLPDVEECS